MILLKFWSFLFNITDINQTDWFSTYVHKGGGQADVNEAHNCGVHSMCHGGELGGTPKAGQSVTSREVTVSGP